MKLLQMPKFNREVKVFIKTRAKQRNCHLTFIQKFSKCKQFYAHTSTFARKSYLFFENTIFRKSRLSQFTYVLKISAAVADIYLNTSCTCNVTGELLLIQFQFAVNFRSRCSRRRKKFRKGHGGKPSDSSPPLLPNNNSVCPPLPRISNLSVVFIRHGAKYLYYMSPIVWQTRPITQIPDQADVTRANFPSCWRRNQFENSCSGKSHFIFLVVSIRLLLRFDYNFLLGMFRRYNIHWYAIS